MLLEFQSIYGEEEMEEAMFNELDIDDMLYFNDGYRYNTIFFVVFIRSRYMYYNLKREVKNITEAYAN